MNSPLRVAIVGAGPAGAYAAGHLLERHPGVRVDMIERLPTPWGLVRAGVAPDHPQTKGVTRTFEWTAGSAGFTFHLNVEVGKHVSHEDVLRHHHAVIYASGATGSNRIGIPGEDLPGSCAAADFVGWYNGHPDFRDLTFDLSGERVVIIGNGNVALDVARILLSDVDSLKRTDIADHALAALATSSVREVMVLGRRGPAQGAFTTPELIALGENRSFDVVVDPHEIGDLERDTSAGALRFAERMKARVVADLASRSPRQHHKRIVLRFLVSPAELLGETRVTGLRATRNELVQRDGRLDATATSDGETIDASLVLRSIGYRGCAIDGVPFDTQSATIPNEGGRVLNEVGGERLPGTYVAGWIKRGPSGVIGTNKHCAAETVEALLADYRAGKLGEPVADPTAFRALLDVTSKDRVDRSGWQAINHHECAIGVLQDRPRVKVSSRDDLLRLARTPRGEWASATRNGS